MTKANNSCLLEMRSICKEFPGVRALDHVDIAVSRGEVHGLIGENGAGKSTLIKIIAGILNKDEGEIYFGGSLVTIRSPRDSQKLGIRAIYQDPNLVPFFSASENCFLGLKNHFGRLGILDKVTLRKDAHELSTNLGVAIELDRPVEEMTLVEKQLVMILRALAQDAKLVIMDEPTAPLSKKEVDLLFAIIKRLVTTGVSILYISHRLEEVFSICDCITIMKDGKVAGVRNVKDTTLNEIIRLMIGETLKEKFFKQKVRVGNTLLRVEGLSRGNKVKNVSLSVNESEVLGIVGTVGSGKTELARLLAGLDPVDAGNVYVNNRRLQIKKPIDAIRSGVSLIPEDRKTDGLIPLSSVRNNITIPHLRMLKKRMYCLINRRNEAKNVKSLVKSLLISTTSIEQRVKYLSGGNQQKTVVAKWLYSGKQLIYIFDEPSKGVDVNAKTEIYKLIGALVSDRKAVIIFSCEIPEIMAVSDRILVMREGEIIAELDPYKTSSEEILSYCLLGYKA